MPKVVDHERRRAEFAAVGRGVIAAEGLGAATLRRIAAAAGCTTGALTHYFPDRATLLIEALRSAHEAAGERMLQATRSARSHQERLRAVLLEALPLDGTRLDEWKVWLAFWAETPQDPALAAEHARRYGEWRGLVTLLVTPLVGDPGEAEREADGLTAWVDGLGLRLTLLASDAARLSAERQRCEALVDAWLARLAPAGEPRERE